MRKLLLITFLFCLGAATARDIDGHAEKIISFNAAVWVDTTGLVKVTETIHVYANGDEIKRGIFRSLPFYRQDKMGFKQRIDISVLEVKKDGLKAPFHTDTKEGHLLIYVGEPDVILNPGEYTYELTYTSRGHVGFFDDFDELYWNVTGNEWSLPIESVTALFQLPTGARIKNTACYTGVKGSIARDCSVQFNADGKAVFKTSGMLAPGEGLTAAVSWQPGLVSRPGFLQRVWYNKHMALAVAGVIYLLSFFYSRWKKYGKDAAKPPVVPSFRPPFNWSPALLRYVYKRKIDPLVFSVSVIHMAVKKLLFIRQTKGKNSAFTLERTADDTSQLAEEEIDTFNVLFKKANRITIGKQQYKTFQNAKQKLEQHIKDTVNIKDYYNSNLKQVWQGGWRTFVLLISCLLLAEEIGVSLLLTIGLLFWLLSLAMFTAGVKNLFNRQWIEGLFLILFSSPFLAATSAILIIGISGFSSFSLVLTAVLVPSYILFVVLIPAYTQKGQDVLAAIEGFRMYLSAAEEHRLNLLMPPEHTPELFERMLPYAIALDLENEWGAKFTGVLAAADYHPDWYSGERFEPVALASSLPQSLGQSLKEAQVSSSSSTSRSSGSGSGSSGSSGWSSGSSGSGSSGGGGGGGGGGGW